MVHVEHYLWTNVYLSYVWLLSDVGLIHHINQPFTIILLDILGTYTIANC